MTTQRITRKAIEALAQKLAAELGHPWGHYERHPGATQYQPAVGAWDLHYNPHYGGYEIQEVCSDAGGVKAVTGWGQRRSGKLMHAWLLGALEALRLNKAIA